MDLSKHLESPCRRAFTQHSHFSFRDHDYEVFKRRSDEEAKGLLRKPSEVDEVLSLLARVEKLPQVQCGD